MTFNVYRNRHKGAHPSTSACATGPFQVRSTQHQCYCKTSTGEAEKLDAASAFLREKYNKGPIQNILLPTLPLQYVSILNALKLNWLVIWLDLKSRLGNVRR